MMHKQPLIIHFVTWYPTRLNHSEGIFIQRTIELLAEDKRFRHLVVRKDNERVVIWKHLLSILGFFRPKKLGKMNIISLPTESKLYQLFLWRFKDRMEKIVLNQLYKKYRPALIHQHVVYGFALETVYLNQEKKVPFIISEHMGPFPFKWITSIDELIIQPIRRAAKVIGVSKAQAHQIESFTGVSPVIIPNVVNETEFYCTSDQTELPDKTDLKLVFTGIYTQAKGGDLLLKVFPEFLKSHPTAMLYMVGHASLERMNELTELAKQLGIDQRVNFTGNLSSAQLNRLYQTCQFYICPSEWESFGLSVLEALFTGLPALCTNCGGVSDFINKDNGLLISNDMQPSTLLNGMLQMASTYHLYNRLKISTEVRSRFSRESIKNKYLCLYQEAISNSSQV